MDSCLCDAKCCPSPTVPKVLVQCLAYVCSPTRLNWHVAELAAQRGGVIIVDATRNVHKGGFPVRGPQCGPRMLADTDLKSPGRSESRLVGVDWEARPAGGVHLYRPTVQ